MRILLGMLLAAAPISAMAAPVVINPSFETPVQTSPFYTYNPAGAGWTFTGGAGIAQNGSAFAFASAPGGTQVAFLQNVGANAISEIITGLTIGGTYNVTYDAIGRPNYGVDPINVSFNSVSLGTYTPVSTSIYTLVTTATFTATGTSGTLSFFGTNSAFDTDSAIDLVSVNTLSLPGTAVPEPMSMVLFASGLLGLGLLRGKSA